MTEMKVDYIDHMGTDLTVVNAARVSMDKESRWEVGYDLDDEGYKVAEFILSQADTKLIHYLAEHNHWTPFGHPQVTLRIKAPIFVARQLGKHQVGMVWNEVSRRYVDSDPEFYRPDIWRDKADNVKQGSRSSGLTQQEVINELASVEEPWGIILTPPEIYEETLKTYKGLMDLGVCPEQARMVLPQSMMTEWYWTGSLAAWARVYGLRSDSHSQRETQDIATMINELISPLYPVSWAALTDKGE